MINHKKKKKNTEKQSIEKYFVYRKASTFTVLFLVVDHDFCLLWTSNCFLLPSRINKVKMANSRKVISLLTAKNFHFGKIL